LLTLRVIDFVREIAAKGEVVDVAPGALLRFATGAQLRGESLPLPPTSLVGGLDGTIDVGIDFAAHAELVSLSGAAFDGTVFLLQTLIGVQRAIK